MNRTVVSTTANILDILPGEDGIINAPAWENFHGGLAMRAVEFNDVTVKLAIDTDDTELEEMFAFFVARGVGLMKFLLENYVTSEAKIEELLKAFQVVFNILQSQKSELEEQIHDDNGDPEGEENE